MFQLNWINTMDHHLSYSIPILCSWILANSPTAVPPPSRAENNHLVNLGILVVVNIWSPLMRSEVEIVKSSFRNICCQYTHYGCRQSKNAKMCKTMYSKQQRAKKNLLNLSYRFKLYSILNPINNKNKKKQHMAIIAIIQFSDSTNPQGWGSSIRRSAWWASLSGICCLGVRLQMP